MKWRELALWKKLVSSLLGLAAIAFITIIVSKFTPEQPQLKKVIVYRLATQTETKQIEWQPLDKFFEKDVLDSSRHSPKIFFEKRNHQRYIAIKRNGGAVYAVTHTQKDPKPIGPAWQTALDFNGQKIVVITNMAMDSVFIAVVADTVSTNQKQK